MNVRIAVDLCGSDLERDVLLESCIEFLEHYPDSSLGLFADKDLNIPKSLKNRVAVFNGVAMPNTISVMEAVRSYKDSTMAQALRSVKNGQYDVVVSGGNTGALVALSVITVGRARGVNRPAIFSPLPTKTDPIYMLDLGANHEASSQDLCDFATMGCLAAKSMGIVDPVIALLNIGSEDRKGHQIIQKAHFLLHNNDDINYIGFVEPNKIFQRPCDIIVCDGFSGNLVLKSIEGTASYFLNNIKKIVTSSVMSKMLMYPLLREFKKHFDRFNPDLHNGAVLLGLANTVVKSHGSSSKTGFYYALVKAHGMAINNLAPNISMAFAKIMDKESVI